MVNFEYLKWEVHPTASAQPFLLAEEDVLVLAIGDGSVDIGPPGNIGADRDVAVVRRRVGRPSR